MRAVSALALLLAVPTLAGAAVHRAQPPAAVRVRAPAADTLPLFPLFAGSDSARVAHPPRRAVEFRPPADHPVLRSRRVTTDAELEAALGDLRAGDEIRLVPGRTYSQGWWSVRKLGAGYATVRTDTVLPNRTVDTTDLRWMAKIATRGQNEPAMRIDEGIRGGRFRGVGFIALPNVTDLNTLVFVGKKDGMDTRSTVPPSDVVFDRVVMYAHDSLDLTRCTLLNARRVALVRSTLWCHGGSSDAMALGGWTGSQQLLIEENRITGNGHGVLFGGNDAPDSTFMPRDLVIRGNRIYKPLSWRGRPGKSPACSTSPRSDTFVPSTEWVGFANARSGDPRGFVLPTASRYAKAGADIAAVMEATAAARALTPPR